MSEYQEFIQWLEEHNWCKATPCENCYYWGTFEERHSEDPECRVTRKCRYWKTNTDYNEYCSRHMLKIKQEGE